MEKPHLPGTELSRENWRTRMIQTFELDSLLRKRRMLTARGRLEPKKGNPGPEEDMDLMSSPKGILGGGKGRRSMRGW